MWLHDYQKHFFEFINSLSNKNTDCPSSAVFSLVRADKPLELYAHDFYEWSNGKISTNNISLSAHIAPSIDHAVRIYYIVIYTFSL